MQSEYAGAAGDPRSIVTPIGEQCAVPASASRLSAFALVSAWLVVLLSARPTLRSILDGQTSADFVALSKGYQSRNSCGYCKSGSGGEQLPVECRVSACDRAVRLLTVGTSFFHFGLLNTTPTSADVR